jgi:predicted AAA+ superfamily ATPase
MFNRDITKEFKKWAEKSGRKPLILRGARQVGKTTAVDLFSKDFDQYIYLNLEKEEQREIFERKYPFPDLLTTLFIFAQKKRSGGKTLIFIDEIQNSPKAVALLRYFYEEANDLFVIAAGSLLESIMGRNISFPVGRVEYMALRPCSFREFLFATNNEALVDMLDKPEVPDFLHDQFIVWFRKYATIGGMPEVLNLYSQNADITALEPVYNSLLVSYTDDIEKYADSSAQVQYIRHIISNVFLEAGTKITFEKFGNSPYRSREIKEAFVSLQKTMLVRLVYPCISVGLPVKPILVRKPRLHVLDTGLINHSLKIMGELVFNKEINDTHRGLIGEHIVGQELLASNFSISNDLHFWVREKTDSSAEVDYVLPYNGKLIPIEVKSGSIGKLRSLHQFMDQAPHHIAVRVWQGPYLVERAKTIAGKEFTLLNLPFYLVHRIERELDKVTDS